VYHRAGRLLALTHAGLRRLSIGRALASSTCARIRVGGLRRGRGRHLRDCSQARSARAVGRGAVAGLNRIGAAIDARSPGCASRAGTLHLNYHVTRCA